MKPPELHPSKDLQEVLAEEEIMFVEEGILADVGTGIKPGTHIAHEAEAAEQGWWEMRTGPTPPGYPRPDTSVHIRYTQPKRSKS